MAIEKQKTTSIYNEALHYGHIGPILTEYEKDFFINNSNPDETASPGELIQLAFDSKTPQRVEHSYDAYTPAINWKIGDTVELARIHVNSGFLGILRRIDTVVIDSTTGENISDWQNPQAWDNVFRFVVGFNTDAMQNIGGRRVYIPAAPLASDAWVKTINCAPLPPFNSWRDARYAWGNPSNKMGVALPKQITVRLFAVCVENTNFKHTIRGRLEATTQLEKSLDAQWRAQRTELG